MDLRIKIALLGVFLFGIVTMTNAGEASKEDWTSYMSTTFPTTLCQLPFYRQCFDVTQSECEEAVLSATIECIEEYEDDIPDVLNQPNDGTYWGKIIGRCVGEAYLSEFEESLISSEKCNNPANWQ